MATFAHLAGAKVQQGTGALVVADLLPCPPVPRRLAWLARLCQGSGRDRQSPRPSEGAPSRSWGQAPALGVRACPFNALCTHHCVHRCMALPSSPGPSSEVLRSALVRAWRRGSQAAAGSIRLRIGPSLSRRGNGPGPASCAPRWGPWPAARLWSGTGPGSLATFGTGPSAWSSADKRPQCGPQIDHARQPRGCLSGGCQAGRELQEVRSPLKSGPPIAMDTATGQRKADAIGIVPDDANTSMSGKVKGRWGPFAPLLTNPAICRAAGRSPGISGSGRTPQAAGLCPRASARDRR